MEEEKLKITFDSIVDKKIEFQKQDIFIKQYFTFLDKAAIISEYLSNLYKKDESDVLFAVKYLYAEYALRMQIVDRMTNINITDLNPNDVMASGLWEKIRDNINNYYELRKEIDDVIHFQEEQERIDKSVGKVLDNVSFKIIDLLNQIAESNIDSEEITKASKELAASLDKLNQEIPGIAGKPARKPSTRRKRTPKKIINEQKEQEQK